MIPITQENAPTINRVWETAQTGKAAHTNVTNLEDGRGSDGSNTDHEGRQQVVSPPSLLLRHNYTLRLQVSINLKKNLKGKLANI